MSLSTTLDKFLNQDALIVVQNNWSLYDGTPTGSPLTILTPPSGSFRCKATISSVAGHTTVVGTLTIGGEVLTFTGAGTKTSTVTLTSKPVVAYSGLDCHIHLTAISTSGADIKQESTTAIDVRWQDYTKLWQDASGGFTQTNSMIFTDSSSPVVGSIIRYDRSNPTTPTNGTDYTVTQMRSRYNKKGTFIFKTLYI
jgi:hypothetical protein